MMRVTTILCLVPLAVGCGGGGHTQVPEVPIDQGGGHTGGSELPPDEVGDAGSGISTVALPDGGPPPGVGPQPLDTGTTVDAGTTDTSSATFVHHQGGLTEKECTDMVLAFAKLTAREKHNPAPTAADVGKDAVYGQMIIDCGATTTKKQQRCTTVAHTSAAWKKCME